MTPEWLPNIHPLIIHFPIALLVIAVLFDVARLFYRSESWLQKTTLALYTTGSIGLIASFLSGQQAVDSVMVTGDAVSVVTSHEDWALYTLIYFLVFTGIRFVTWWNELEKRWVLPLLIIFALTGTGMLWYTSELGAKLVFKHGVAVSETDRLQQRIDELEREVAIFREDSGPIIENNGSWTWRIGPGADQVIHDMFHIDGEGEFIAETQREDGILHLSITADGENYLLFGDPLSSIEGRAELHIDEFEGEFQLLHHYQNPENYQYLRLRDSVLSQGQVRNGTDNVLDSGQITTDGWFTLRVTADGRHFYGYSNDQTIVHTHAEEMEPGTTGIYIQGEGIVRFRVLEFNSLD